MFRKGRKSRSGSVFFALFGGIAMVGVLGAATIAMLKGPVRAMNEITRRTVAENNMIAAGKLAIIASEQNAGGDCDGDGAIEPLEWADKGANPAPAQGGLLPVTIGASLQDPWGNGYGYCVWDHGSMRLDTACGASPKRLKGSLTRNGIVLAVISSGRDRIFQTGCNAEGQGPYLNKVSGSDDIVLGYTYQEAEVMSGGLWRLKENDVKTAEINKNISVKDVAGIEQLSFDVQNKVMMLGSGGTGVLPKIKTDFIQPLAGSAIEVLSNIKMDGLWISADGTAKGLQMTTAGNINALGKLNVTGPSVVTNNAASGIGIDAVASGTSATGLKVTGTAKAIESNGILDMMNNKIVKLAAPTADTDAATKKYVDDKFGSISSTQTVKCESFVFTGCTGSVTYGSLTKTNLGACKKACEAAGVQCCEAEFASLPGNPNAQLTNCKGYDAPSQTSGGLRNLLTILLGGGKFVAALCYLE